MWNFCGMLIVTAGLMLCAGELSRLASAHRDLAEHMKVIRDILNIKRGG